jgi:hypothetical protein
LGGRRKLRQKGLVQRLESDCNHMTMCRCHNDRASGPYFRNDTFDPYMSGDSASD